MVGCCLICNGDYFNNRYISANVPENNQVKQTFAVSQVQCIRWGACLHVLPDVLGQSSGACLESSFFGTLPADWISQQTLWDQQAKLYFMGIPSMRTITATVAFKMPLCGISFPLSASSELLTEASKPLLKIKACLLSTEIFSISDSTSPRTFEMHYPCILMNCINLFFPPRNPVMDCRGFFIVLKAIGMVLIA